MSGSGGDDPRRYRARRIIQAELGGSDGVRQVLVYAPAGGGAPRRVAPEIARALVGADRFRTLAEHTAAALAGQEQGQERGQERGHEQGQERGPERGHAQGQERGQERGPERGPERGHAQGQERGQERGHEQGQERGPERGQERGPERGQERGQARGQERGQGQGQEQRQARGGTEGPNSADAVEHAVVGGSDLPRASQLARSQVVEVSGPELLRQLSELAAAGLLLERGALVRSCAEAPPQALSPIAWVAMPTRDRPAVAARATASALANAREHGRRVQALVMDDSEDPRVRATCVEGLAAASSEYGLPVHYGDTWTKSRFIAALEGIGAPADSARFALRTSPDAAACPGANRNAILLATHGARLLGIDDDIVCTPARSPLYQPGARVFSGVGAGYTNYNPAEFWFYGDRAATLADNPAVDLDVLRPHEQVLGRSLAGCIADAGGELDLGEALDPAMLDHIDDQSGRVLASFYGSYGDIGWYSPTWLAFLEGRSRERLVASPEIYLRSCDASREVLRVVDRVTLNDGRYCQTAVIGFDNRDLLPPFIPLGRYEDGVFRLTLRTCFQRGYFAYLPYALLHDPQDPRGFNRQDIHRTGSWVRIGEVINQCILAQRVSMGDPRDALGALGRGLIDLARSPVGELRGFLQRRVWEQKSRYLEHLCGLLRRYGRRPAVWAADVSAHIDQCAASLEGPDSMIPREFLIAEGDPERALLRTRRLVGDLGRLFVDWPAIVEAAELLRERGVRLAEPVVPA